MRHHCPITGNSFSWKLIEKTGCFASDGGGVDQQRIAISRLVQVAIANILVIALALLLIACHDTDNSQALTALAEAPGAFKVAILLPGRVNDNSWSQAGYEGLKLIEKQLGAQVAYRASVPPAEGERLFRYYAQQGFDFLISHGAEYIKAAEVIAQEFPRVKFAIVSSYAGNNQNIGALAFRSGEVGYLTGAIAALKTKSKNVAYIGGQQYPITQEEAILFQRGAKSVNPSVATSVDWVNSWSDVNKARAIARERIAAGADVLVVDADEANVGVFQAAQEHPGTQVIGWAHSLDGSHKTQQFPSEILITRVVQRVPILLLEGATLAQQGRWEGKQYKFGLLEEVQDLAPFKGSLSAEEEAFVSSVKQGIITGKIDVSL
ncbi:MAG TPA: BMP family protein [Coleofasciculaceae cyanobacterium]